MLRTCCLRLPGRRNLKIERRFLTIFFGGEKRSKNLLCLLSFVKVVELLLLGMEVARCSGDNHFTDVPSSLVAVTKDAVPESLRLSSGVGGNGLLHPRLHAAFPDIFAILWKACSGCGEGLSGQSAKSASRSFGIL